MKTIGEVFIWPDAELVSVVGDLLSVHHGAWDLDRPHKVEVVVALMISEFFDLTLFHCSSVESHDVVDWERSRHGSPVRNHVKIENSLIIRSELDNTCINNGSGGWVCKRVVDWLDEASVDPLVHKRVEDFWRIVLLKVLQSQVDEFDLVLDHEILVARATNSISVDYNLSWELLILVDVVLESILQEIHQDFGSLPADSFLLLSFGHGFTILSGSELLLLYLTVVLGKVFGVGSSLADQGGSTRIHNINTNDHSVNQVLILGEGKPIQITLALGIDLLKNVGADRHGHRVLSQGFLQDEL